MLIETTRVASLTTLALLALSACGANDPTLGLDLDAELADEDKDEDGAGSSAALTTDRDTRAFPGFGVHISVAGDDVVLDWSATGPTGTDVRLFRSTNASDLAEAATLSGSGAEQLVLPAGATSFVDAGAAAHDQPTPDTFYRITVDGSVSTMLMKKTTAMAPGYNKLGLCMLDGPTHASDVAAQLGGSVTGVWTWSAASQCSWELS